MLTWCKFRIGSCDPHLFSVGYFCSWNQCRCLSGSAAESTPAVRPTLLLVFSVWRRDSPHRVVVILASITFIRATACTIAGWEHYAGFSCFVWIARSTYGADASSDFIYLILSAERLVQFHLTNSFSCIHLWCKQSYDLKIFFTRLALITSISSSKSTLSHLFIYTFYILARAYLLAGVWWLHHCHAGFVMGVNDFTFMMTKLRSCHIDSIFLDIWDTWLLESCIAQKTEN